MLWPKKAHRRLVAPKNRSRSYADQQRRMYMSHRQCASPHHMRSTSAGWRCRNPSCPQRRSAVSHSYADRRHRTQIQAWPPPLGNLRETVRVVKVIGDRLSLSRNDHVVAPTRGVIEIIDLALRPPFDRYPIEPIIVPVDRAAERVHKVGRPIACVPGYVERGVIRIGDRLQAIESVVNVSGGLVFAINLASEIANGIIVVRLDSDQWICVGVYPVTRVVGKLIGSHMTRVLLRL